MSRYSKTLVPCLYKCFFVLQSKQYSSSSSKGFPHFMQTGPLIGFICFRHPLQISPARNGMIWSQIGHLGGNARSSIVSVIPYFFFIFLRNVSPGRSPLHTIRQYHFPDSVAQAGIPFILALIGNHIPDHLSAAKDSDAVLCACHSRI